MESSTTMPDKLTNDQFFVQAYNMFATQAGGKFSLAVDYSVAHLISLIAGMYGGDTDRIIAHLYGIADNIRDGVAEGRITFDNIPTKITLQ